MYCQYCQMEMCLYIIWLLDVLPSTSWGQNQRLSGKLSMNSQTIISGDAAEVSTGESVTVADKDMVNI